MFYKLKITQNESQYNGNQKQSDQEKIASVHGGDRIVNEFSNFFNFHKIARGTSNLLISNIY